MTTFLATRERLRLSMRGLPPGVTLHAVAVVMTASTMSSGTPHESQRNHSGLPSCCRDGLLHLYLCLVIFLRNGRRGGSEGEGG